MRDLMATVTPVDMDNPENAAHFKTLIYTYYSAHARQFPWRETDNPYHLLVSEFMLQQTQAERVIRPYCQFIAQFPDISPLARAPLQRVLQAWSGLGYNRRALNLKKTAEIVREKFSSTLPSDPGVLMTLPGIGRSTACAVAVFAFHEPVAFIETNIRTVFIHFFFQKKKVTDTEILPLVEKTLDRENPRAWYYALMDYGVMLKKKDKTLSRKSAHYTRQSPFEGSNRQVRGRILDIVTRRLSISEDELVEVLRKDREVVRKNVQQLEKEGFLRRIGGKVAIG